MKVLNIGSMNIDYVYSVDHIILPGETQSTFSREVFLGGKGINQSIALAKAGIEVYHAGCIGEDGDLFLEACALHGVNAKHIRRLAGQTGSTVIQVDRRGQNSILLYGGSNQALTEDFIDSVLEDFSARDLLLLQNEVNLLPYIVDKAYEKGMKIVLNPSPFNEKIFALNLEKISLFLLNEVEGSQLTGKSAPPEILECLRASYPQAGIVLTLGKDGAYYADAKQQYFQAAFPVEAVDTTAAGDTFTGYFIAGLIEKLPVPDLLKRSAKASAIAVTRPGAINSIPLREEVEKALA